MSPADEGVKVTTTGGRHGAVAGTINGGVHNNSYYQVPPDASPRKKYTYALRYLDSWQGTTARRLLAEVVVHIRDEPQVWFHWLLAFFSGRTFWELSVEDRLTLVAAREQIHTLPRDGRWSRGIEVIEQLVDATAARARGVIAPTGLDDLDPDLRRKIQRHLERVLEGPMKDALWESDVEQARADQTAGQRAERVWKFFEPDPAGPRARLVRPPEVDAGHLALLVLTTATALIALGTLGWLALRGAQTSALIAIMAGLASAGWAMAGGVQWRFRLERQRAAERERRSLRLPGEDDSAPGFVRDVDRLYRRYLRRVVPDPQERASWLRDAYAPTCRLRDELVEVYRETRVPAAEVKWLIRFQVRELRREWADGTLARRRVHAAVPPTVKLACTAGAAFAAGCVLWAALTTARQDPLLSAGAFVAIMLAGWVAADSGLRIAAEHRRVAVEAEERRRRLNSWFFEYQRWQQRLADRPTDVEMAKWLDCDRRILLHHAICAYKLRWSDVTAYASLEARGDGCRRARTKNGPWRYSQYKLLVFLLTSDGVRQLTVGLNFETAEFRQWQRTNYRYDAVAAVRVTEPDDGTREFQLFLVNGADIEVGVTEAAQAGRDEDPAVLTDGAQDATGLRNTLFVLEGVAAEGRSWWAGPAYQRAG